MVKRRRKRNKGEAVEHKEPEPSPDNSSQERMDQSMEDKAVEHKEPEPSPDNSSPKRMDQSMEGLLTRTRSKGEQGNAVENRDNNPEFSLDNSYPKKMDQSMEGPLTRTRRKRKRGKAVKHKDKYPESSLDNSSPKKVDQSKEGFLTTRTRKRGKAVEDSLHESSALTSLSSSKGVVEDPFDKPQALTNLSSSEVVVELSSMKKKKNCKKQKIEHSAIVSNVNSCGETDIFQGENEKKEQDMLGEAKENSNGECDVKEVSCSRNPYVENAESSAKESVLDVVNFSIEKVINDNSSNPDNKSSIKNATLPDNYDDYPVLAKLQFAKTYTRKKKASSNSGRNSKDPSHVNCKEELTMQNHHKDDSQFFDGPSTIDLMEIETKCSRDQVTSQSGAATEKMELITENPPGQISIPMLSEADIPVVHNEEANCRQQDLHKDDSEFFDGPLTVDLMEIGTKCSRDQATSHSGAATEKMELITENPPGQIFIPMSSEADIPVVHNEEANCRQIDHATVTSNDMCCAGDVSDLSLVSVKDGHSKISNFPLGRTMSRISKKKLLILDLNGLLVDIACDVPRRIKRKPDLSLKMKKVFMRPFCHDFLQFCFDKFHVGVWSSRQKSNVDKVIRILFPGTASRLLFCWDNSHCTPTGFSTVEDKKKPLVLKELRKLWRKLEPDLPWQKGEFNESNTLLLDDSPHKALMNPSYTAVFPYPYVVTDTEDRSLGPGGDIRVYLEGLAMADNVQDYVRSNPFGERAITKANPSWQYFRKVIAAVELERSLSKNTKVLRKRNAKPPSKR